MPDERSTIAIIQARMGSSRLPGKVLLDIGGQPMLVRVVERTRRAQLVDQVVVATTTDLSDDAIASMCTERGYPCYRGSLHDVLDRYFQAAKLFRATTVVRITADCPVIDPDVIDRTIRAFWGTVEPCDQRLDQGGEISDCGLPISDWGGETRPYDFAANRLPPPYGRSFPIGLDTEVCSFEALERAWKEADQLYQREHVMPYLYEYSRDESQTRLFRTLLVNTPGFNSGESGPGVIFTPEQLGKMRWTVDTPKDLELVRKIFAYFDNRDDFSWLAVLELFHQQPELADVNAQVTHKTMTETDQRTVSSNPLPSNGIDCTPGG